MKKLMLSALLSSIVGVVHSQLLYSITKPNVDETSYLYGTIHLGDSVLLSWDNTFLDAFYSCDVQVGEIDFINLEISPTESGMIDMMTEISKYDSLKSIIFLGWFILLTLTLDTLLNLAKNSSSLI
jgi:uncharacterized protein YbaP (TraB family)